MRTISRHLHQPILIGIIGTLGEALIYFSFGVFLTIYYIDRHERKLAKGNKDNISQEV